MWKVFICVKYCKSNASKMGELGEGQLVLGDIHVWCFDLPGAVMTQLYMTERVINHPILAAILRITFINTKTAASSFEFLNQSGASKNQNQWYKKLRLKIQQWIIEGNLRLLVLCSSKLSDLTSSCYFNAFSIRTAKTSSESNILKPFFVRED